MKKILSTVLALVILSIVSNSSAFSDKKAIEQSNSSLESRELLAVDAFTREDVRDQFQNYTQESFDVETRSMTCTVSDAATRTVGMVYDFSTGNPISNAVVVCEEFDTVLSTDENGRFAINNLPVGQCSFEIKAKGYQTAKYLNHPICGGDNNTNIYSFGILVDRTIEMDYDAIMMEWDECQHDVGELSPEGSFRNISAFKGATLASNTPKTAAVAINNPTPYLIALTIRDGETVKVCTAAASSVDNYLYYVVYPEAINLTSYGDAIAIENYKAQAVASRTFADYIARNVASYHQPKGGYSVCAETHCQRYYPVYTNSNVISAVDQTSNQVLFDDVNNKRPPTEFHGACTGTTVFNGVTAACYKTHSPPASPVHNRGMCQTGASLMAKDGKTYAQILSKYYPGTVLITAKGPLEMVLPGDTKQFGPVSSYRDFLVPCASASYTFQVSQSTATSYPVKLEVFDASDTLLQSSTGTTGAQTLISRTMSEGMYRIRVTNTAGGLFSAMLTVVRDTSTRAVDVNGTSEPYFYVANSACVKVRFVPTQSRSYTIQTYQHGSSTADPYLRLLSSSNTALAVDDDGAGSSQAKITYSLTANTTYYIEISTYTYQSNRTSAGNFYAKMKIT